MHTDRSYLEDANGANSFILVRKGSEKIPFKNGNFANFTSPILTFVKLNQAD